MNSQSLDSASEDRAEGALAGPRTRASADSAEGLGDGGPVSSAGPPSDFFSKRGISTKVADARPYIRYAQGDPDRVVRAHWPDNPRYAARIARQASGLVIPRYAPRALGLANVPAELRPDSAVATGSHWHYHGDPQDSLVIPSTGTPLPKRWTHRPDEMARHIEKVHDGTNPQTVHLDENWAKYVFPPGEGAKRLDVHPQAWTRFVNAPRVFFVIEGCLKADAVLSAGEAVFSVPSVTLWNAPELQDFTRYLRDKVVYIVPDSDWIENRAVITQAMFCRSYLRKRGIEAHVAAPPMGSNGEKVGVDDFLGSEGKMDDLTVLEREAPFGLAEFLAERGVRRKDRVVRDAQVLEGLALHADSNGEISASLRSVGRAMGVGVKRVSRGVADLHEFGAITVDGPLDVRARWYGKGLDWRERPKITIHPELRAKDTTRRLGK